MSSNNGILFNGVLIPKLRNNPFVFCSFINFDLDNNIFLQFLVFKTFEPTLFVFFLHFKHYISMFYMIQFIKNPETIIFHSALHFFL